MTPERWQQIKSLLHSALERDPAERSAFLDEACAGNRSLQSEVEALITSSEQAKGKTNRPGQSSSRRYDAFLSLNSLKLTGGRLKVEPTFDGLRSNSRFTNLVQRIGLR